MIRTRPATQADLAAFGPDMAVPMRTRALTIERDGEILAVGGLMDLPDGGKLAFCNLNGIPGKAFGKSLHRAGKDMIALARELGAPRIIAWADPDNAAAERWLRRFGFSPIEHDGRNLWLLCLS